MYWENMGKSMDGRKTIYEHGNNVLYLTSHFMGRVNSRNANPDFILALMELAVETGAIDVLESGKFAIRSKEENTVVSCASFWNDPMERLEVTVITVVRDSNQHVNGLFVDEDDIVLDMIQTQKGIEFCVADESTVIRRRINRKIG